MPWGCFRSAWFAGKWKRRHCNRKAAGPHPLPLSQRERGASKVILRISSPPAPLSKAEGSFDYWATGRKGSANHVVQLTGSCPLSGHSSRPQPCRSGNPRLHASKCQRTGPGAHDLRGDECPGVGA